MSENLKTPQEDAQPVFLVTTENAAGRSARTALLWIGTVLPLLLITGGTFAAWDTHRKVASGELPRRDCPAPMDPAQTALIAWAAGLAGFASNVLSFRFGHLRGAWALDSSGIEFQPLRGAPRSLKWSQVEAVYRPGTCFRGRGVTIPLTLAFEDKETAGRILAALERWLGDAFDLRYHGREMTQSAKLKILLIAAPFALCFCAAAVYVAYDDPYLERKWLMLASLTPLWLLLFVVLGIHLKDPQSRSWRYRKLPPNQAPTNEPL